MNDNGYNRPRKRSKYHIIDGISRPNIPTQQPYVTSSSTSQFSANPGNNPDMPKASTNPQTVSNAKNLRTELNTSIPNTHYNRMPHTRASDKPKPKRRDRKWSWKRRLSTIFVLIVVVALCLGGWDVWQLEHKVNHLSVGNLTASVGGAENILVAGSTNRCNLKVQNAEWGFCSQGVTGVNSDVIFIVHIVPATKTISILSIPRDTFVPNARSGDEAFKIDAALYEGPTQLVNAIQEDFGIPIQHYAEVGFDGFVNIVNAVGGIKMDFPEPVYDSESYLDVKTPGCKLLNGVEALQVVRARHLQYDPPGLDTSNVNLWPQENESDIARIARTHEFLRVLGSSVSAQGLGNPITDQKLIDAIAPNIQVDSGLSTSVMLQLAEEFHAVNINKVQQYTLPISTTDFGDYIWNGNDYGDVVFPAEANDQQVINQFLGVSNASNTMTGNPLPNPSSIAVNVINSSGILDQASQTTAALHTLGFNTVGDPGSKQPLSYEAVETVVNYASHNTEADAEAVARQLTGPVILSENAGMVTSGSEVTVLTGTGLSVNTPSNDNSVSAPTGAASQSATNSSASSTATTTTDLEPASSASQALSPWDPRACTQNQPVENNG